MRITTAMALIGLATGAATTAAAQVDSGNAELNNAIEMVRSVSRLERKVVITDQLAMTNDESTAFWPVYNAYAAEIKAIDDRLAQLILDFAEHYENLPDDWPGRWSTTTSRSKATGSTSARNTCASSMTCWRRESSPASFKLENKLNVLTQLYLADEIPLALQ